MAVYISDNIRDDGLEYVLANVTRVILTVGEPTSYANVNTNYGTGSGQGVVAASVSSEDFTIGSITGGRRCSLSSQEETPSVNANGVNHWCWVDDTAEAIEAYGPATSIDVTTSGPVTMPEHGIRMPAAVLYEA